MFALIAIRDRNFATGAFGCCRLMLIILDKLTVFEKLGLPPCNCATFVAFDVGSYISPSRLN